jgi:isopenicillin N synthase-like dioxygenase
LLLFIAYGYNFLVLCIVLVFVQVVNHGVSPQLLDETFQEQRKFFELPNLKERLKKYTIYSDKEMSQVAKMENETIRSPSNWRDNMALNYAPNPDTQKWPTEPPNFMYVSQPLVQ